MLMPAFDQTRSTAWNDPFPSIAPPAVRSSPTYDEGDDADDLSPIEPPTATMNEPAETELEDGFANFMTTTGPVHTRATSLGPPSNSITGALNFPNESVATIFDIRLKSDEMLGHTSYASFAAKDVTLVDCLTKFENIWDRLSAPIFDHSKPVFLFNDGLVAVAAKHDRILFLEHLDLRSQGERGQLDIVLSKQFQVFASKPSGNSRTTSNFAFAGRISSSTITTRCRSSIGCFSARDSSSSISSLCSNTRIPSNLRPASTAPSLSSPSIPTRRFRSRSTLTRDSSRCQTTTLIDQIVRIFAATSSKTPLLLEGPPGFGKTQVVTQVCALLGKECERIHMSANISLYQLIGYVIPRVVNGAQVFQWQEGLTPLFSLPRHDALHRSIDGRECTSTTCVCSRR